MTHDSSSSVRSGQPVFKDGRWWTVIELPTNWSDVEHERQQYKNHAHLDPFTGCGRVSSKQPEGSEVDPFERGIEED